MTISNDGATIMKLLEIVHPAAKVLVDISASQDAEVLHSRRPFTVSCGCLTAQLVIAQNCCIALLNQERAGCILLVLIASAKVCSLPTSVCIPATQLTVGTVTTRTGALRSQGGEWQNAQVGDGTTTVVILAGELLRECKAFVEEGVHPQVWHGTPRPADSTSVWI